MSRIKIVDYAKNALLDELYAKAIYSRLAECYRGKDISREFEELAKIERRHANFWMGVLKKRGHDVSSIRVNKFKIMLWISLFRVLGVGLTFKILESDERDAIKMYSEILENEELSNKERSELKRILEDELIGVYGNPLYVALSGLIVGIGGVLSMAIGVLISVRGTETSEVKRTN